MLNLTSLARSHSLTFSIGIKLSKIIHSFILVRRLQVQKITNAGKLNDSCERCNLIVAVEMNILLL